MCFKHADAKFLKILSKKHDANVNCLQFDEK